MFRITMHTARGFSFIEAIVAIVISGILAVGIVSFISDSAQSVESSASRNRLAASGRIAIERMAFELHNALPRSIRTTSATPTGDQCIEFVPVRAATTYVNPAFTGSGTSSFDVVDFIPSQHGATGGWAVIYPRRQNQIYDGDNGGVYANWPNFPNRRPIQEIVDIQNSTSPNDQSTVTLTTAHRFNRRSPNQRFFVVDQPVSYCIKSDKLYRYTDYGFFQNQVSTEESGSCVVTTPTQCLPDYDAGPTRKKVLITDSIDNTGLTAFSVGTQSLNRNSLVAIILNFTSGGDTITINHEVLTRSVP